MESIELSIDDIGVNRYAPLDRRALPNNRGQKTGKCTRRLSDLETTET